MLTKKSPIKIVLFSAVVLFVILLSVSIYFLLYVPFVAEPAKQYRGAVFLMYEGQYEEAVHALNKMGNYRDSVRLIEFCENAILEGKYAEAVSLYESGEYSKAIAAFSDLGNFLDSTKRAEEIRKLPMEVVLSVSKLDLFFGDTASVSASILPYTAEDKSIIWSSDDETIATVDDNGLVKAVKPGVTAIAATAHNGKTKICVVEVYDFATVYVSTPEEFREAVRHYTTILFSPGSYVFSANVEIKNLKNLTLIGDGEVQFLTRNLAKDVITFIDCMDITLQNITFGHVNPSNEYQCEGGVLCLENSSDITIDQCKFFGSGSVGIRTDSVNNLYVTDTQIYECTLSALSIRDSKTLHFSGLSVHSNKAYGYLLNFYQSDDILFTDSEFYDNWCNSTMISMHHTEVRFVRSHIKNNVLSYYAINDDAKNSFSKAYFYECEIKDNIGDHFIDDPNAVYTDCVIESNRPK